MLQDLDETDLKSQAASIAFEELQIGDHVFDFADASFGTIIAIINEEHEPEWKRIEVEWEREENVLDKSFVLSDTLIGVELKPDHSFFPTIAKAMGDKLPEMQEEYGDELVMLALAKW